MLTLESIIAATRQQTAFGEARNGPIPRDRAGRPKTPKPTPAMQHDIEEDMRSEYVRLLGKTNRTEVEEDRYQELSHAMDRLPHPGMTDEENRCRIEVIDRIDAAIGSATQAQLSAFVESLARPQGADGE